MLVDLMDFSYIINLYFKNVYLFKPYQLIFVVEEQIKDYMINDNSTIIKDITNYFIKDIINNFIKDVINYLLKDNIKYLIKDNINCFIMH